MTTSPTPSLIDTIPDLTDEEKAEITRLEAQSQTELAQLQALLDDPQMAQFAKLKKTLPKKEKEIEKLRNQHAKTIGEITLLTNRKRCPEPTEKGFYIFTHRRFGWGRGTKERTDKSLLLFALGVWWNLTEGGSTVKDDRFNDETENFHELLGLDERTIEATIEKLADETIYPYLALQTGAPQLDFDESDHEDDAVEIIGEPQGVATS